MLRVFHSIVMFLAAFSLVAYGGGGGDSSSSGGGSSSSTLSLSSSSVNISAVQWGGVPSSTDITATLSGDAEGLVVSFATGANSADWLDVQTEDGNQTNQILLKFNTNTNTNNLTPGNYSTSLTVTSGNSAGTALDTRNINVNLTMAEGMPIEVSPTDIDLNLIRLSHVAGTREITVTAEGEWNAVSQNGSFSVSPTTRTGSQDITLSFTPSNIFGGSDILLVRDADSIENSGQTKIIYNLVSPIESSTLSLSLEGIAGGEIVSETVAISTPGVGIGLVIKFKPELGFIFGIVGPDYGKCRLQR